LAGGSALALHLGHRISIDLDFFTSDRCYQSEPLVQQLRSIGELVVQQQSEKTLVGSLNGVRLSFFFYPYPVLGEFIELDEVQIASLLDIALMKLIAISQRGKKRDFVDLFLLATCYLPLATCHLPLATTQYLKQPLLPFTDCITGTKRFWTAI